MLTGITKGMTIRCIRGQLSGQEGTLKAVSKDGTQIKYSLSYQNRHDGGKVRRKTSRWENRNNYKEVVGRKPRPDNWQYWFCKRNVPESLDIMKKVQKIVTA